MTTTDIISYVLIGLLFVAIMVPLIALLVKSIKELRELDGSKASKKPYKFENSSYIFRE